MFVLSSLIKSTISYWSNINSSREIAQISKLSSSDEINEVIQKSERTWQDLYQKNNRVNAEISKVKEAVDMR